MLLDAFFKLSGDIFYPFLGNFTLSKRTIESRYSYFESLVASNQQVLLMSKKTKYAPSGATFHPRVRLVRLWRSDVSWTVYLNLHHMDDCFMYW